MFEVPVQIEGKSIYSGENVRLVLADGRIKARKKIDARIALPRPAPPTWCFSGSSLARSIWRSCGPSGQAGWFTAVEPE